MQKRLVVAGLELIGADQEAIWIGFYLIDDIFRGKAIEAGFGDFCAPEFMLAGESNDRPIRALALD
ncbi:hypothetical protein ABIF66_006880 [Bradyrhizobium japonicum]